VNATLKAPNISVAVQGLRTLDANTLPAAAKGLRAGLQHAAGLAQRKYLSGPRPDVLDVVTTRLRGSVTSDVQIEGGTVRGFIGSNVSYAPYHEFGFQGNIKVRAHTRAVDNLNRVEKVRVDKKGKRSSGLYRFDREGKVIGYKTTLLKLAASRGQLGDVSLEHRAEHERTVNYKGRPFVRPAVLESVNVIAAEVRKELAALAPKS